MKVLLVGGASSLGKFLVPELVKAGNDVVVYDIKLNPKDNVKNKTRLKKAAMDVDMIVNMATVALGECFTSPQKEVDACITGTVNCIEICNQMNIPFVYISTSEVYGRTKIPMSEKTPCNPTTPYGVIKRCGEMVTQVLSNNYLIIRPFNFYGPYMREDEFATIVTKAMLGAMKRIPVPIYGEALSYTRDWTYIEDMAFAVLLALQKFNRLKPIINIGSETETSVTELIRKIEIVTGKKVKIIQKPGRKGDIKRMKCDCTKFMKETNYLPSTDLYFGLKKYYEWLKRRKR